MIIDNHVFLRSNLVFEEKQDYNLFALKNNKTLMQTLETTKYSKFKNEFQYKYPNCQKLPLGQFLITLKEKKDDNYKKFLNKYGDGYYCRFKLVDINVLLKKGVYIFKCNDEIKYIGRCQDSFKSRINIGYGKISPKNCFIDGQSTNCHMNELIMQHKNDVTFWFLEMQNDSEICSFEKYLIEKFKPEWNISLVKK